MSLMDFVALLTFLVVVATFTLDRIIPYIRRWQERRERKREEERRLRTEEREAEINRRKEERRLARMTPEQRAAHRYGERARKNREILGTFPPLGMSDEERYLLLGSAHREDET